MTAPAPILLPRTAAPDRARDAATAAAVNGPRGHDSTGFAAHLARETPPADAATDDRPSPVEPSVQSAAARPKAEDAPDNTADAGKDLPATRQKPAAQPAATPAALLALAATQALIGAEDNAGDPTEPAATPAGEESDAAIAALTLIILPGAALPTPSAPAAPAQSAAAGTPATTIAPALQPATPRTPDTANPTVQSAHPAAFAVASLVLEREAATQLAPQPAPPEQATPDVATQTAARAQPSTLAALTGAPTPERTAARKPRAEAELALPAAGAAALPAPETAGALAQAQPSFAPAASPEAAASSGPQPISFDQLVDSIARARDGLDPAGPVSVALRHAEFGRISLRIEGDVSGLSVAMASPDPAFAPAVAAAHAAATAEPARAASAEPRAEAPGQSLSQSQSQGQAGTGQQRQNAQAPATTRPAANPARSSAPDAERRGGIFA